MRNFMDNILEVVEGYEEEMISDMLEENISLREEIREKEVEPKPLTFKERKLILSELNNMIYDIKFHGTRQIKFYFNRINLYLDPGTRTGDVPYNKLPFYYLWKLGFINFRTSKSVVTMSLNSNGNHNFITTYERNNQRNPHDNGLNCWGGWTGVINKLIREKKFYDAVLHIASRMKQATINDGVTSFDKLCAFDYETQDYILLNDQQAVFFKDEINWLMRHDLNSRVSMEDIKPFRRNEENGTYHFDMRFQSHSYRLAISEEIYDSEFRR